MFSIFFYIYSVYYLILVLFVDLVNYLLFCLCGLVYFLFFLLVCLFCAVFVLLFSLNMSFFTIYIFLDFKLVLSSILCVYFIVFIQAIDMLFINLLILLQCFTSLNSLILYLSVLQLQTLCFVVLFLLSVSFLLFVFY